MYTATAATDYRDLEFNKFNNLHSASFVSGFLRSFEKPLHPGIFQLLACQSCLGKYAGMLTSHASKLTKSQ